MAFNGQLANFNELRDELLTLADYHLTRNLDTEVIMHYLSYELRKKTSGPTFFRYSAI